MKAVAVFPGKKDTAHIRELERPEFTSKHDVLVEALEVGVCGTDREIHSGLYGEPPEGSDFLILGHESLGIVKEVGSGVSTLEKGDYVVSTVRRPDGCINCLSGESDMCIVGDYRERGIKGLHGFMSEYFKEHEMYLVRIPPTELYREVGVLLEPLSIVEKGVDQVFKIQRRIKKWKPEKALILGAGPIGLLATLLLWSRGLETYTTATRAGDSLKSRLVEMSGGTYINARENPIPTLKDVIGNIDLIFEAAGNSELAIQAVSVLGRNGITCLSGICGPSQRLSIPPSCLNAELVLDNKVIFGTVNAGMEHFREGVKDIAVFENLWPGLLHRMITRRVRLSNFREVFEKDREGIKTVLEMNGQEST